MRRCKQDKQDTEVATSATVDRSRAAVWAAAGALGLLAALLLASSSAAAGPKARRAASSSVISACYNNRTGALRRVAGGGRCGHGQTSISWTVVGPAGGGGEAGPMGPMGLRGVEGAAGAPGLSVVGATGSQGREGPPGAQGVTGATGENGAAGTAGKEGAAGPTGPSGQNGAPGAEGPPGPAGGSTGPTGPVGAPGSAGGTLPSGQTETGEWSVFLSAAPEPKRLAGATISFPVSLELAPSGVHYLTKAVTLEVKKGEKPMAGCKATAGADEELLEKPVAEPGNLCVYSGEEHVKPLTPTVPEVSFKGFQNAAGATEKASRTGAFVMFGYNGAETLPTTEFSVQGSWAVTAP